MLLHLEYPGDISVLILLRLQKLALLVGHGNGVRLHAELQHSRSMPI